MNRLETKIGLPLLVTLILVNVRTMPCHGGTGAGSQQTTLEIPLKQSKSSPTWQEAQPKKLAGKKRFPPQQKRPPVQHSLLPVYPQQRHVYPPASHYPRASHFQAKAGRYHYGLSFLQSGDSSSVLKIVRVLPRSQAALAGLEVGDEILLGRPFQSIDEAVAMLDRRVTKRAIFPRTLIYRPGPPERVDHIQLTVRKHRTGKIVSVGFTPGKRMPIQKIEMRKFQLPKK